MISINIASLDKRITFIGKAEIKDEYGLTKTLEHDIKTVWARIEPLRGKEFWEAQKIRTVTTFKITTLYHKGLDQTMNIRFRDRIFEVQTITEPYMNKTTLEFICVEKQKGEGKPT